MKRVTIMSTIFVNHISHGDAAKSRVSVPHLSLVTQKQCPDSITATVVAVPSLHPSYLSSCNYTELWSSTTNLLEFFCLISHRQFFKNKRTHAQTPQTRLKTQQESAHLDSALRKLEGCGQTARFNGKCKRSHFICDHQNDRFFIF